MFAGMPMLWASKLQTEIVLSSTKAKLSQIDCIVGSNKGGCLPHVPCQSMMQINMGTGYISRKHNFIVASWKTTWEP